MMTIMTTMDTNRLWFKHTITESWELMQNIATRGAMSVSAQVY